jgi:hypothetical protein
MNILAGMLFMIVGLGCLLLVNEHYRLQPFWFAMISFWVGCIYWAIMNYDE